MDAMLKMSLLSVIVMIILVVILLKKIGIAKRTNADVFFDVFLISGNQLTILTAFPITYNIDEIKEIQFSYFKTLRIIHSFIGKMQIIKVNGEKSLPFRFDSSVYKKKFVLRNSKEDIEKSITYLMKELERHHIFARRLDFLLEGKE